MGDFEGKVALVTGAGSGIGRASARAFARRGAAVLVTDVDDAGAAQTVAQIEAEGGTAIARHCDVANAEDVESAVAAAVSELGGPDCAHNNAGYPGDAGLLADYDIDMYQRVFDVNSLGTFLCMKYEIAHMASNGGGAIVNTASGAGLVASPLMPAYVASKHAVVGLTRVAGIDYATRGIRVNAICPGVVDTPMIQAWIGGDERILKHLEASEPSGRMARPEEMAEAAVWLCSDASSYVTATALPVDGGATAYGGGGAVE